MKIIIRSFWIVFALITIQACSGIKVSQDYEQDYDFSGLKTFSWKPNENNEYGITGNDLVEKRIRAAIQNNLLAKNYTQIDTGKPDFYISYHVTIEQKISSSNVSGSVSLGRSSRGRYGGIGISSGSQVKAYDQGTLLINVTDVENNKLIWRGISTQSVAEHSDPDKSTVLINETVEKVLSQFPPK
ncbi:MAG: DUF4136 domain-containing protein [Gammaproteobacteria bacterium]|nr:DUF4136 domain-containing protein [Gammaproteobacteria bacterium]